MATKTAETPTKTKTATKANGTTVPPKKGRDTVSDTLLRDVQVTTKPPKFVRGRGKSELRQRIENLSPSEWLGPFEGNARNKLASTTASSRAALHEDGERKATFSIRTDEDGRVWVGRIA